MPLRLNPKMAEGHHQLDFHLMGDGNEDQAVAE